MGRKGVTLIEVMVALCILCIAFLFLLSSLPLMSAGIKSSENQKGAALVGGDILERVRMTPFSQITATWKGVKGTRTFSGTSNGVPYTISYIYGVDVAPPAMDSTGETLLDVTVSVSWEERGKSKTTPLETMVYNSTSP